MIQTAINLTEAITLRDQGIRQAAENNKEFLEVARNSARSLAISKYEITADDVRRECKLQPLHPNAWGAVFRDPDDPGKNWMKHVTPGKNIDRIRKDLTILAGYHEAFHRVDNSVRIEAKSISFGSMSEDEFEKFYSATIEAVLKHVCKHFTGKMLDEVVDQALSYAA